MNRQRWCITMDVLPVLPLGRTQPQAYACLDSARGWTAADITRAGGARMEPDRYWLLLLIGAAALVAFVIILQRIW